MSKARFNHKTFNAEAFGAYRRTLPNVRRNELIKSEALRPNQDIRDTFNQTGVYYSTMPMFGRIGGTPQNYDGVTDIVPSPTTTFARSVIVIGRMKAWIEKDFAEDITGGAGFMSNVARQVNDYWQTEDQEELVAILNGVYAMTGAENLNFINRHTFDISSNANPNVAPETLNSALQQACGDNKRIFSLVCMHSTPATNLENQGLLEYFKYNDANGIQRSLPMATWNGKTVLIDDNMPTIDIGGGNTLYTTYALGVGAIDHEDVGAEVPHEMVREAKINGGQTSLISRQRKVFAPYGIDFTKAQMASRSPLRSELSNGVNWSLVQDTEGEYFPHKAIPIARIISRG